MTTQFADKTVAVIGVGLMGGSLGLAAQALAGVPRVRGFGHRRATLDLALERGAITDACDSLEAAVAGADLDHVGVGADDVEVTRAAPRRPSCPRRRPSR